MTNTELDNLIKNSGAQIPPELINELKLVVEYQESMFKKTLDKYDLVLRKIAFAFDRKSFDINPVHPESMYVKILWGINNLTNKSHG